MNILIIKLHEKINKNQLRLKFHTKDFSLLPKLKKINIVVFLLKQENFKIISTLKVLFYFKLLTNKKCYLSYYKKKYKENNLIFSLELNQSKNFFFWFILLNFYFPILFKRNILFQKKYVTSNNLHVNDTNIILFPFLPNSFLNTNFIPKYNFIFNKHNSILLDYYNFPILK